MDLSISRSQEAGVERVSVVGEVDVSNASELREALDATLEQGPAALTVDMAQVAYIDSTGIGVLVGAATRAAEGGVAFSVANPQANVKRVLGLLGVEQQLHLED